MAADVRAKAGRGLRAQILLEQESGRSQGLSALKSSFLSAGCLLPGCLIAKSISKWAEELWAFEELWAWHIRNSLFPTFCLPSASFLTQRQLQIHMAQPAGPDLPQPLNSPQSSRHSLEPCPWPAQSPESGRGGRFLIRVSRSQCTTSAHNI